MKKLSMFIFALIITAIFSQTIFGQDSTKATVMNRYVVERTFPKGLNLPVNEKGCQIVQGVISNNSDNHVTLDLLIRLCR